MVDQHRRTLPWIALGVVYVLWGSTYLANRYIIVSAPPLLASGFRFMTGGLLLGLLVLVFAGPRTFAMTRAQLGTAALSGLLLPAWGNGLVILAQSQVASGLTALLIASVPLYIAVLRALTGDRPRRATVLGVLVGAAGLALLVLVGPTGGSGGVLLGLLVLVFAGPRAFGMSRAQFGTAALSGLLLPAWGNGLVIVAQSQVASGLTALLIASVPLYIAVLRALTGDRPRRATVLGVLVGAVGLALLVLVGPSGGSGGVSGSAWWGPPLVLLAGAGWATGTFAATRLAVPANPFALATVQQLIGGAILVFAGTARGERLHPAEIAAVSWWAWLYMSLFVSLGAFSAYAYALSTLPVSTVATYAYVNPVIAVLLGVVVADERFSVLQLAGGAIVLVAVVMVIAAERRNRGPVPAGVTGSAQPTRPVAGRTPPC